LQFTNPTNMKRLAYLMLVMTVCFSCSTKRQVEKALNSGNYNAAISNAIDNLKTNKGAKRKQDIIFLLKDAYVKANERDLEEISRLKVTDNPELYRNIYETYSALDKRQEAVKPLLPLTLDGKEVKFKFKNYTNTLLDSKEQVSNHLYKESLALLESEDKLTIRKAYNLLEYIETINPNYDATRELLDEAHERGIYHVIVSVENQTDQIIPRLLEEALLDFETYGLNQFWTSYHNSTSQQKEFDYSMKLQLQQIIISPEQIKEREILRESRVKDGWEYRLDRNGNVMKDSLGDDIKVDKFIIAKARVFEIQQFKSSQILGEVIYSDTVSNHFFGRHPIESGFIFENIYATFLGNRRALNKEDIALTRNEPLPFPTNEQMVFDTGEDLKNRLKQIIFQVQF
jgi:hypothetical protein